MWAAVPQGGQDVCAHRRELGEWPRVAGADAPPADQARRARRALRTRGVCVSLLSLSESGVSL
jgi:hypothetical protein